MKLKNLMEGAVFQAIDEAKGNYEFCDCEKCRVDIAALALNQLPPRYVVTEKGDSYARTDFLALQKNLDVFSTVIKAIKKVKESPSHD